MHIKEKGFSTIFLILIVITAIGVYFGVKQFNNPSVSKNLPTIATSSSSPEPKSDWKTYTNKDFTFEYPNENFEIQDSDSKLSIVYGFTQYPTYLVVTKSITIDLNSLPTCLDNVYEQEDDSFPCLARSHPKLSREELGLKTIYIDKYKAKSAFIYKGPFEGFYRIVEIPQKNMQLEFYATVNDFIKDSEHTINTFKFNN